MNPRIDPGESDALLVVDIQNDFCEGGSLAVPSADEIIPSVNRLACLFRHVILTQDWHPSAHLSFASSHPGKQPFDTITVSYGPQMLWPDHCVQGTRGADFHPKLHIPQAELILRKGYDPAIDSYSAFCENDRATATGLGGYLRQRGLSRIFIAGLAFDYCVRFSAEDAHTDGFGVVAIEDACRSIAAETRTETRTSLKERGIPVVGVEDLA
jgi:nicotinamidase/pyrazinamidase